MEQQDFQRIATGVRPTLMRLCQGYLDRQAAGSAARPVQELAYDAEDAVQETLLRLWQMRDRLGDYQRPEALAMLIARNVCLDILKLRRERHERLDETALLASGAQADQSVMAHEAERLISDALKRLPATQRRMLVMRSEGMSMAEIAAACGTTTASAKTMICTARKRMMGLLKMGSAAAAVAVAVFLLTGRRTDEGIRQTGEGTGRTQTVAVQSTQGQATDIAPKTTEGRALPGNGDIAQAQEQESATANPTKAVGTEQTATKQTATERPATRQKKTPSRSDAAAITEQQVQHMMAAANYANEQVESYRLRPVGDATIVTKTLSDGTSASFIVCLSDDSEGLHVVPLNTEL